MSNIQATPGRFARVQDWWWEVDGFDGDCLSVLAALCKFDLKGDGVVFPSQSTIAHLLRKSRSWVNKRIGQLVEIGLIRKQHVRRDNGGESSCIYHINYANEGDTAHTDSFSCAPEVTGGVADSDSKNKNPNTNTQVSIHDWKPRQATVDAMMIEGSKDAVERCISRFRSRVEKKGYNYADFDDGLRTWWKEDRFRFQDRPAKNDPSSRAPVTGKAATVELSDDVRDFVSKVQAGEPLPGLLDDTFRFKIALGVLSREMDPAVYALWIDGMQIDGVRARQLHLRAPNAFHAERIRVHHEETLVAACRRVGFDFDRLSTCF